MESKIEGLVASFLEGNLDNFQKKELEKYLAEYPDFKNELKEIKNTFHSINKPKEIDFDIINDQNFYKLLANQKFEQNKKAKSKSISLISIFQTNIFKYAAGISALLFTFWFGRQSADNQQDASKLANNLNAQKNNQIIEKIVKVPEYIYQTKYIERKEKKPKMNVVAEIGNLKKEMQATKDLLITSLLKRESASDRIQGVNYTYELDRPDNEVLKALIFTLDNDSNINVRNAAAEAIARFGYDEYVRNALINSLLKQNEPSLQISIIETLIKLHERRALPAFKLLADDSGTADEVKQKAEQGTKLLNI